MRCPCRHLTHAFPTGAHSEIAVLRKNSIPLGLNWRRGFWPAVASSQRDRSASRHPSVAGRPGRIDRALGQTTATIEAENLVLRRQLALFKERGMKPRRIDAATRASLALLSRLCDWRSCLVVVRSGNRVALAPSRMAAILALQVATGTPTDSAGTAPTDPTHGHGQSAVGRGADCQRIAAEARFAGLPADGTQVHAEAAAGSPAR